MPENATPVDTNPRSITLSSADRLAGLMPKLAQSMGIEVEETLGGNGHFWYLVGRNYATQKKRIPETLKQIVNSKESVRKLALVNSIEQSRERFFLEKEAATDKLTGAFNRRSLDAYLENILSHRRRGIGDVFVMMDIDDFKQINDRFGHPVGDVALQKLVSLIDEKKRGVDFLARYGGEEFAIILPGIEMKDGWKETMHNRVDEFRKSISEQLQTQIEEAAGVTLDKELTASFGVAFISGEGASFSSEDVYNAADKNLYTAKHSGKNTVVSEVSRKGSK